MKHLAATATIIPMAGHAVTLSLEVRLLSGELFANITVESSSTGLAIRMQLKKLLQPGQFIEGLLVDGRTIDGEDTLELLQSVGSPTLQIIIGYDPLPPGYLWGQAIWEAVNSRNLALFKQAINSPNFKLDEKVKYIESFGTDWGGAGHVYEYGGHQFQLMEHDTDAFNFEEGNTLRQILDGIYDGDDLRSLLQAVS